MNYQLVQKLVDPGIIIDIKGANVHDLRASNDLGNDESWRYFTPELYASEEELAATINQGLRENRIHDKEIETGYKS